MNKFFINALISLSMIGTANAANVSADGVLQSNFIFRTGELIQVEISSSSELAEGTMITAQIKDKNSAEDGSMDRVRTPSSFDACIIAVELPNQEAVLTTGSACLGSLEPKTLELTVNKNITTIQEGSLFLAKLKEDFPFPEAN